MRTNANKITSTVTTEDGLTRIRMYEHVPVKGEVKVTKVRDFTGKVRQRRDGKRGMSQVVLVANRQSETFHVPTKSL